eukprot:2736788-Pyramimonas_sp.AAC.1
MKIGTTHFKPQSSRPEVDRFVRISIRRLTGRHSRDAGQEGNEITLRQQLGEGDERLLTPSL